MLASVNAFVGLMTGIGFHAMAWILAAMMAVTVVGVVYDPSQGQSLEEIQEEQQRT